MRERRYLTPDQVLEIRALPRPAARGRGGSRAPNGLIALAEKYGVSRTAISNAITGKRWKKVEPRGPVTPLPGEEWRPVPGWEDRYEVSSQGRVISARQRRLMKPLANGNGYPVVSFHRDGRKTSQLVHRLVAAAFLPPDPMRPQVNHKDFDRTNAHVSNLEWCTGTENLSHAAAAGRLSLRAQPRATP